MIRSLLNAQEASLRKKIKAYLEIAEEVKGYLSKNPHDWGKFQSDFNIELNGIFRDIMNFEKKCLTEGDENSVYKLKRIFVNHLRKRFVHGDCVEWTLKKPYGYAGDFKIIDDIYRNQPRTHGFDRLFDNYVQMCPMAIAVRNRKADAIRLMSSCMKSSDGEPVRFLDLAGGPCRDLKEFLSLPNIDKNQISIDCYDQDGDAIIYAKGLLEEDARLVNFVQENVLKIALRKDIKTQMPHRYDLIFSLGLFDYLDARIATRLVKNLGPVLKKGGKIFIANVREKYQNPSLHFLEWVGDWNLIYRSEEEFMEIFLDAGFDHSEIAISSEQQGIIQYVTILPKN